MGLIAAVALGRADWAGSVGLATSVAGGRASAGGAAAQAVRRTAARSRDI